MLNGKNVDREIKSQIYMFYWFKMTKCIKWQNVYNDKRYKMAKRLKLQNMLNDKTYEMTKHFKCKVSKMTKRIYEKLKKGQRHTHSLVSNS
jgi:hypothetical protein